jgi:hypothetical protein
MPRDPNGNYTLPAGNPVVTGTLITSTWANPTLADVANELTNSLSRSGQGGMLVPFQFLDGLITAPGLTFTNEPTLGFYRAGNGIIGVAGLGVNIASFNGNTGNVTVTAPAPTAANALTRKDYVDGAIDSAIADLIANLTDRPIGAIEIGWNPNGVLVGTWTQWPEGTFIMNTVGGADPSGGSNDAVVVSHSHGSAGNHQHAAVGDHGHNFRATPASENSASVQTTGGFPLKLTGVNYPPFSGTPTTTAGQQIGGGGAHQHAAAGDHTHPVAGVSGTGKNKPLYKGVAIWERTA